MKIAPFTVVLLLFCFLGCKKNDDKNTPIPSKPKSPVQLKTPFKDQNKPDKEKDKNSLLLDSLKVRTASLE